MNRRNFLRSGSLAMIAVAGLPKASRAFNNKMQTSSLTYRSKPEEGKEGQWLYEISIDHNTLENFKNAKPLDKNLLLKMAFFAGTDFDTATQQGDAGYVITKVKATDNDASIWEVTIKADKNMKDNTKLDKDFPKSPKLFVKKEAYVEIRDKKGNPWKSLAYVPPTSSGSGSSGGCFLTTACVQHKQLTDDCDELETLRYLRDQFMKNDKACVELVKQYQVSGPAIVRAINNCENKGEIYDYMYDRMILPSVNLVKQESYSEAVEYYKTFVKALLKQYN